MTDFNIKRFLEREFQRLHARIDKVEQQNRDLIAHQRTARELLTNTGEELRGIKDAIEKTIETPRTRMFPITSADKIKEAAIKFQDPRHESGMKREIAYALSNVSKDDWLRAIITDNAANEFHRAEELRNVSFIRHIIPMVSAAKGRVYSKQRRDAKKRLPDAGVSKENSSKTSDPQPGSSNPKRIRTALETLSENEKSKIVESALQVLGRRASETESEKSICVQTAAKNVSSDSDSEFDSPTSPAYSPLKMGQ
ncbi:uncharacterized protein LOC134213567 isoform X2 [Armigeres subalbatus]|uniref:uncharacterized protein LOC134213567 isoform X2 n=1 Tax=Armigeres subalbatus TaxID=124917 RepID=UPI002ED3FF57